MSESNRVARVLVVLLLAGMIALFVGLAIDMVVPAPANPWETSMEVTIPPAKQEALDASRTAIGARLDKREITQDQADDLMMAVDEEESRLYSEAEVSPAVEAAYQKALSDHGVIISLLSMVAVALLLAAGVVLVQRGISLAEAPLFAGAILALYAAAMGASLETVWLRLAVSGAVAVGATSAGLKVFARPAGEA